MRCLYTTPTCCFFSVLGQFLDFNVCEGGVQILQVLQLLVGLGGGSFKASFSQAGLELSIRTMCFTTFWAPHPLWERAQGPLLPPDLRLARPTWMGWGYGGGGGGGAVSSVPRPLEWRSLRILH